MRIGSAHAMGLRGLAALGVLALIATAALATTPFDSLLGAWSGTGQARFGDGSAESVRCQAYYTEGGVKLRLAIRCKSASNEIEIRGHLTQSGSSVSGTWEERTFNVAGEAKGQISSNRMTLNVVGGGFSGSMSVTLGGPRQTVTISTQGISLRSVNVVLARG